MKQFVRSKIGTPGILLTIAVAIAFLISAFVSHDAHVAGDVPVAESASAGVMH
jgi:hypothetical protein